MHDLLIAAGWEIQNGDRNVVIVSPSGFAFAVYIQEPRRPLIYDVFDTFKQYNRYT